MICPLCDEPVIVFDPDDAQPIGTPDGMRQAHRICLLRNVIGGIGHLIAHEYWCAQRHDPDAGLTRYQSAQLVETWVHAVGTDVREAGNTTR